MAKGRRWSLRWRRLENEEARRFEIDLAVGDHPLHALKVGDGLPELPALLDVGLRRIHGGAGDAERERGDADAPAGEFADRDPEAVVLAPHQGVRRHAAAVEAHGIGGRASLAHFLLGLANDEARRVPLDQEAGDALPLRRVGVRHGPDHEQPGVLGAGDVDLFALDQAAVAVAAGARRHARSGPSPRLPRSGRRRPRGRSRPPAAADSVRFCASDPTA